MTKHSKRWIDMLTTNFTRDFLNLQDVEIEKIENSKSPCCNTKTNKIHDYRTQVVRDCKAFGDRWSLYCQKDRQIRSRILYQRHVDNLLWDSKKLFFASYLFSRQIPFFSHQKTRNVIAESISAFDEDFFITKIYWNEHVKRMVTKISHHPFDVILFVSYEFHRFTTNQRRTSQNTIRYSKEYMFLINNVSVASSLWSVAWSTCCS